ncbi:MAG: tetratricopeptide repeat protein [Isosphaeraceae bacterium]|nr:tetratricopeptide repeat protein [Isosphaeraceae bacterium]
MERSTRWAVSWRRIALVAGCAGVFVVGLASVEAVPAWLVASPASVRDRGVEWFLRAVLIAYGVALVLAGPGTLLLAALTYRAWRRRAFRPWMGRGVLAGLSLLAGLALAELGASLRGAWAHRMPALPARFKAAPADEIHVVVVGESSALGDPFGPWLSVGQIVGWQLERVLPARRVRVSVLAERGVNLERMHQKLETLDQRPDVLIVYCGHNEFQSRYDWARGVGHDETPLSPAFAWLFQASLRSPLCRLIYEQTNRKLLAAAPRVARHQLVDPPLCSPSEAVTVVADFERRLDAMAFFCARINALAILVIPPSNEAGFAPNRSGLHGAESAAARERFVRAFAAARLAEADPRRSITLYDRLLEGHPEFAEAHFRLARQLEKTGDWAGARRHYIEARDRDGFPQRCTTPIEDAYRTVAARRGAVLIDGPAELRSLSPTGILNDNLFHDPQHPALAGHVTLARAVLRELRARGAFGWTGGPVPTLDPAECAAHFQLGSREWSTVCTRVKWFYKTIAKNRFDPSERFAKAKRFGAAAEQIRAGTPPEQAGIPGLGARPKWVEDPDWAENLPGHRETGLIAKKPASPGKKSTSP